jgi:hypothetical protein
MENLSTVEKSPKQLDQPPVDEIKNEEYQSSLSEVDWTEAEEKAVVRKYEAFSLSI